MAEPTRSLAFRRHALAWSVHLVTLSGAVWGFLALIAFERGDIRAAMLWMVISIVVDSVDGTLARAFEVARYAQGIDGALLDNILDYFTYVAVPAYALYATDILPVPWRLAGALFILVTSAYQFSQTDAKTDDHYFKGFPSYWNVVVIYLLLLPIPAWVSLGVVIFLNVMIFVPIKYIYPSRTVFARQVTLAVTIIYGMVITYAILRYPQPSERLMWFSLVYILYYVGMSLLSKRMLRSEQAG